MKVTLTAIIFIIFVLIVSIIVANVANFIKIDHNTQKFHHQNDSEKKSVINKKLIITDTPEHLMWFLQISDLHISMFTDQNRIKMLREFVNETLDIIKPTVVVASGDLTDGRDKNYLISKQFEADWQTYNNILTTGNVNEKTIWLDIRGNHDNFNVPGDNSNSNFFRTYSMQGVTHKRSYVKHIEHNGDLYSFIGIDACMEPGLKFPFNFVGVLTLNETNTIMELATQATEKNTDYIVWFGHYPSSCIVTMKTGSWGFRQLLGNFDKGYVYLCGHLHTLGDLVTKMYTHHSNGFLELELGDWKQNRIFRIAAFDHGLFSFVDTKHNKWPIVLVTNPKNAYFHIPEKENPKLQLESTHIRVLVFARNYPINVHINLNDGLGWQECIQMSDVLYVLNWNPIKYADGLIYNMEIDVTEANGISTKIIHPFSMEQTHKSYDKLGTFVLTSDLNVIFRTFFGVAVSLCIAPLIFCRIWFILVKYNKLSSPQYFIRGKRCCGCVRNYWILSTVDRITIPIILYCIYLTIGPWTYGEVTTGIYGYVFAWGIYIDGGYVPQPLTYFYGFFQLIFCQLPLIYIFAYIISKKFFQIHLSKKYTPTKCHMFMENGFFFFIMLLEIFIIFIFWYTYGILSVFIGPFHTWSIVLNIILWQLSKRIPAKSLKPAGKVWYYNKSTTIVDEDENPDEK